MKALIDASYFIHRKVPLQYELYTTESVERELKDVRTVEYYKSISHLIRIIYGRKEYKTKAEEYNKKYNLELSTADIEILAIMLEQKEYICLTDDNRIRNALKILNINIFNGGNFKIFMHRFKCIVCFKIYKAPTKQCRECGYARIRRINIK